MIPSTRDNDETRDLNHPPTVVAWCAKDRCERPNSFIFASFPGPMGACTSCALTFKPASRQRPYISNDRHISLGGPPQAQQQQQWVAAYQRDLSSVCTSTYLHSSNHPRVSTSFSGLRLRLDAHGKPNNNVLFPGEHPEERSFSLKARVPPLAKQPLQPAPKEQLWQQPLPPPRQVEQLRQQPQRTQQLQPKQRSPQQLLTQKAPAQPPLQLKSLKRNERNPPAQLGTQGQSTSVNGVAAKGSIGTTASREKDGKTNSPTDAVARPRVPPMPPAPLKLGSLMNEHHGLRDEAEESWRDSISRRASKLLSEILSSRPGGRRDDALPLPLLAESALAPESHPIEPTSKSALYSDRNCSDELQTKEAC